MRHTSDKNFFRISKDFCSQETSNKEAVKEDILQSLSWEKCSEWGKYTMDNAEYSWTWTLLKCAHKKIMSKVLKWNEAIM